MNACIVVPIYQQRFTQFEVISLKQLFCVLGNYPVIIVAPKSLKTDSLPVGRDDYSVELFPDEYFESTESYSSLCLSEALYERFLAYDYMLLYQTDAFVFSDRLMEFVEMGYDYIGAPMNNSDWDTFHVGNGGLSLRRIKSCLDMVKRKKTIVNNEDRWKRILAYEDIFFGYCAYSEDVVFTAAPIEKAMQFSIDDDSFGCFRSMSKNGLPFGTHRWVYAAYSFWKPVIEAFGYTLPDAKHVDSLDMLERDRKNRLIDFIPEWLSEIEMEERNELLKTLNLDSKTCYTIWGRGINGKRCYRILRGLGIRVLFFIDKAAYNGEQVEGISVFAPSDETISKSDLIMISVLGHENEIEDQIKRLSNSGNSKVSYFAEILEPLQQYIEERGPIIEGVTRPYSISIKGGVNGRTINYPESAGFTGH